MKQNLLSVSICIVSLAFSCFIGWQDNGGLAVTTADSKSPAKNTWVDAKQSMSPRQMRDAESRTKLMAEASFRFDETPFEEVVVDLEKLLGVQFHLDQSAQDDGLINDQPITFRLKQLPASVLLQEMLAEHNATYTISNGLVKVISRDVADDPAYFVRRYFNVADLLEQIRIREPKKVGKFIERNWGPNSGGLFSYSVQGFGGATPQKQGTQSKGGGKSDQGPEITTREYEVLPDEILINTIMDCIDTDNWEPMGGYSTIRVIGGIMIVNSKESTAAEVEDLLENLRLNWVQ